MSSYCDIIPSAVLSCVWPVGARANVVVSVSPQAALRASSWNGVMAYSHTPQTEHHQLRHQVSSHLPCRTQDAKPCSNLIQLIWWGCFTHRSPVPQLHRTVPCLISLMLVWAIVASQCHIISLQAQWPTLSAQFSTLGAYWICQAHMARRRRVVSIWIVIFLLCFTIATRAQSPASMMADSPEGYNSNEHDEEDDQTAYPTIKALVNRSVGLPCNISQSKEENSIKLILWYKNDILGTPIYSVDARDSLNISLARHFVAGAYRERATFELNIATRTALFFLKPLVRQDEGHYICRVDYRWTRTTISTVRLDVVVPAARIGLSQWARWKPIGVIKERNASRTAWLEPTESWTSFDTSQLMEQTTTVRQPEGSEMTLACDSIGGWLALFSVDTDVVYGTGKPMSIVKWYRVLPPPTIANGTLAKSEEPPLTERTLQLIDDSYQSLDTSARSLASEADMQISSVEGQWETMGESSSSTEHHGTKAKSIVAPTNHSTALSAIVRNELHLGTVSSSNHGQLFLCRTSNSNLTKPIDLFVKLQIYARPKSISIRYHMSANQLQPSSPSAHGHQRNRTNWHSIELLDSYLHSSQPLISSRQPIRLRSGHEFDFICQSNGSWPAASLFWYLRDWHTNILRNITHLSSWYSNGHDTLSYLRFVPQFTDNKASLICQTYNQALHSLVARASATGHNVTSTGVSPDLNSMAPLLAAPDISEEESKEREQSQWPTAVYQLHTSVLLDVNYKPIVSIQVLSGEQMFRQVSQQQQEESHRSRHRERHQSGNGSSPFHSTPHYHHFVESEEIFFNCSINANPEVYLVQWFVNQQPILTDISQGIIITNANRTLILSSATKRSVGSYHCSAANILGETTSDPLHIDILFKPQCQVEFVQTYYHQLGDYVQLKCHILANPVDNLKFTWRFNNSIFLGDSSSGSHEHSVIDHMSESENNSVGETSDEDSAVPNEVSAEDAPLATTGGQVRSRRDQWPSSALHSTTTHTLSEQLHLITNVVRIQLKTWTSFGYFSCQARNKVGTQRDSCQWHILPQYQAHYRSGSEFGATGPGHHYPVDMRHHQHRLHHYQQHLLKHPTQSGKNFPGTLNNCQIIESSNAVVIKCFDGTDLTYEVPSHGFNDHKLTVSMAESDHANNSDYNQAFGRGPTGRLTYHVQVFRLHPNSTLSVVSKSEHKHATEENKSGEEQFSHQIDHSGFNPEIGKQIASMPSSVSSTARPSTISSDKIQSELVMDTLNFTNPLFIITNLSSSTSYLLRIWSSNVHLESMIEQVNITVRTKPDDSLLYHSSIGSRGNPSSAGLFSGHKLEFLLGLVALISLLFVVLIFTYAFVKIRSVLDVRKARRAVNVNESISAFETALCEMRPETLENDLKYNKSSCATASGTVGGDCSNYTLLDTFKPYANGELISDDPSLVIDHETGSPALIIKCDLPESSLVTYQNYLFPMASGQSVKMQQNPASSLRVNCSDEESVTTSNTSASNRSMLTSTTESSTLPNSHYSFDSHRNVKHTEYVMHEGNFSATNTVPEPSASNLVFCMNSCATGDGCGGGQTVPNHAFLLPDTAAYHRAYHPMKLQIVPETGEEGCSAYERHLNAATCGTVITPGSEYHTSTLSDNLANGSGTLRLSDKFRAEKKSNSIQTTV